MKYRQPKRETRIGKWKKKKSETVLQRKRLRNRENRGQVISGSFKIPCIVFQMSPGAKNKQTKKNPPSKTSVYPSVKWSLLWRRRGGKIGSIPIQLHSTPSAKILLSFLYGQPKVPRNGRNVDRPNSDGDIFHTPRREKSSWGKETLALCWVRRLGSPGGLITTTTTPCVLASPPKMGKRRCTIWASALEKRKDVCFL